MNHFEESQRRREREEAEAEKRRLEFAVHEHERTIRGLEARLEEAARKARELDGQLSEMTHERDMLARELEQAQNDTFCREDYRVQHLEKVVPGWGPVTHLRIYRDDGRDGISWDALQAMKDEYFPDARAVEVYPAQADVVNEANIRHLWIVPPDVVLPTLVRGK